MYGAEGRIQYGQNPAQKYQHISRSQEMSTEKCYLDQIHMLTNVMKITLTCHADDNRIKLTNVLKRILTCHADDNRIKLQIIKIQEKFLRETRLS